MTTPQNQDDDIEWISYRSKFSKVYDDANYDSTLQARIMNSGHRLLESPFSSGSHFNRVLEVGAGTGQHLSFVKHSYDEYILSDLDPEALAVAEERTKNTTRGTRLISVQNANVLKYDDDQVDRLIATHVLEHLPEPHLVMKEWRRVIKNGGMLSILIPTDPGLMWRFGRCLGPRRRALAQGIAYDYIMAREHINSANNLIALLRHYFPDAREQWWPLRVPTTDLNLFIAFNARIRK